MLTPEERAAKLMDGVHSINLKVVHAVIPWGPWFDYVTALGYEVLLRNGIAAAIREAEAEATAKERARCLALTEWESDTKSGKAIAENIAEGVQPR